MEFTFGADEIKASGPMKTDGSYKVEITTGEYEREAVAKLMGYAKKDMNWKVSIRPLSGSKEQPEEKIEGRTTPKEEKSSVEGKDKQRYAGLWSKIKELAEWQNETKEEVEKRLKTAWHIESFTDLSEEDLRELEASLESDIQTHIENSLKGKEE